jgi:EipB-like
MDAMTTLCLRRAGGEETIPMTILGNSACRSAVSIAPLPAVIFLSLAVGCGGAGAAEPAAIDFAAHRAIYELKLAQSHSSTMSVRGRILYDFSGNSCEGYALLFRQVSELDNGEGRTTLSDLRSTSWEEGAAKRYVFKSQNYLNETLLDTVDGEAERGNDGVSVKLAKPSEKKFNLEPAIAFPTDHMRRIIAAAREEKSILEVPLYDGSDKGDKVFNTLTVIGRVIAPNERPPADAAAGTAALASLRRWPVTVSYFDRSAKTGDRPPVYAIKFELYENGISRALVLDYNDFAIAGDLTSIDIKDSKPCR